MKKIGLKKLTIAELRQISCRTKVDAVRAYFQKSNSEVLKKMGCYMHSPMDVDGIGYPLVFWHADDE